MIIVRRDSRRAARRLCRALQDLGFAPEVHGVCGKALIWVWPDVLVWTDGHCYLWWSGEWCRDEPQWRNRRWKYASCPVNNPAEAATRIAELCIKLRWRHPLVLLDTGLW